VPIPDEAQAYRYASSLDDDVRAHLDEHMPLASLARADFPASAADQRQLADLVWTRAVLLGQYALADAQLEKVARGRASTAHLYARYAKAATPQAKHDAALLILANAPELTPRVTAKADDYFRYTYWSCYPATRADDGSDAQWPAFVTPALRNETGKEIAALRKLPHRTAYLVPRVIAWAKANKDDPEAPKALHFLVASSRNECTYGTLKDESVNYSKMAFEFLHKTYPDNEWTRKTRYYY
jgi:hypothetical protein